MKLHETTLDQLLAWAKSINTIGITATGQVIEAAYAIIDMLGESAPCTAPEYRIHCDETDTFITIEADLFSTGFAPAELRALCAMWLRAADEADAMKERK